VLRLNNEVLIHHHIFSPSPPHLSNGFSQYHQVKQFTLRYRFPSLAALGATFFTARMTIAGGTRGPTSTVAGCACPFAFSMCTEIRLHARCIANIITVRDATVTELSTNSHRPGDGHISAWQLNYRSHNRLTLGRIGLLGQKVVMLSQSFAMLKMNAELVRGVGGVQYFAQLTNEIDICKQFQSFSTKKILVDQSGVSEVEELKGCQFSRLDGPNVRQNLVSSVCNHNFSD
jgi:hypothetical protein